MEDSCETIWALKMSTPESTKSQALLAGRVAKPAHLGNKHVAIELKKIVLTLANYYIYISLCPRPNKTQIFKLKPSPILQQQKMAQFHSHWILEPSSTFQSKESFGRMLSMRNNVLYPIFGVLCNSKSSRINYCYLRSAEAHSHEENNKIFTRDKNI